LTASSRPGNGAPTNNPGGRDEAHEYFEHDADFGVVGRGPTLEEAFVEAARATFALMVEPTEVHPTGEVEVAFEESDVEIALVRWLNGLLGEARVRNLALADFELRRSGEHWVGRGRGDPWSRHQERGTEVKGATLTMLAVHRVNGGWEARCVVDV